MPTPALSHRLSAVADLVPKGASIADVCADHGMLAIELVRSGRSPRAWALDIADAPLELARANVLAAGLGDVVSVRRSDGLTELAEPVDCAVYAGIGGRLLLELLGRDEPGARGIGALVLQPNKKVDLVRAWLDDHGWAVDDERLVHERGRFFEAMRAVPGDGRLDRADLLLGPVNRRRGGEVFEAFRTHTEAWMSRELTAMRGAGRIEDASGREADLAAVRDA